MKQYDTRSLGEELALLLLLTCSCSLDPIGGLYEQSAGPYTESVGPYTRLTFNPGPDWFPAWSTDGSRIAYTAWGFEEATQGQMTVNAIPWQGGVSIRISPAFSRIDYNLYPFWMEGDAKLGYVSFRGLNLMSPLEPSLTIVDPLNRKDFTENLLGMNSPLGLSISPDGSSVVYSDFLDTEFFSGDMGGIGGEENPLERSTRLSGSLTALWRAAFPLSGDPVRIEGSEGGREFSWSPDSDSLVFSRDGSLFIIPVGGGTARPLAEGGTPAWSPEGARIACSIDGNMESIPFFVDISSRLHFSHAASPSFPFLVSM